MRSMCTSTSQEPSQLTAGVVEVNTCWAFKYHQGSKANGIGWEMEVSPTLIADVHNPAVIYAIREGDSMYFDGKARQQPMCGQGDERRMHVVQAEREKRGVHP